MEPLTERELEVLSLIAEGLSNQEVSQRLFISLATVKWHTSNIYGKLGVKNRTQAIAQARARLAVAEEDARRLEDQLAKHTIRAPFDGYVIAKHTEVGAWVSTGDAIVEVISLSLIADVCCWITNCPPRDCAPIMNPNRVPSGARLTSGPIVPSRS